ncbi:unnamed protein product [Ambrosiozyma monospora]|uniref:Unnamed protein product n=1 Tax=Ambrosiozyma monospora TaxID=43982 RepID=A0ACB5T722_AMBMO|nr:unnamed protein product [Ambrosiozyma monospora]
MDAKHDTAGTTPVVVPKEQTSLAKSQSQTSKAADPDFTSTTTTTNTNTTTTSTPQVEQQKQTLQQPSDTQHPQHQLTSKEEARLNVMDIHSYL